jgi:hypothetical protein
MRWSNLSVFHGAGQPLQDVHISLLANLCDPESGIPGAGCCLHQRIVVHAFAVVPRQCCVAASAINVDLSRVCKHCRL